MKTNFLIYSVLLISLLMTNGCASTQQDEATPTSIMVTVSPISPTPTKTMPTLTSIPTLSVEAIRQQLLYFLRENGGCRFPCIWGLTPGISSQDRESYLSRFREISLPDFYSNSLFNQEFNFGGIGAQFIAEDTTVYTGLTAHEKNGAVEILLFKTQALNTNNLAEQKFGDAYYIQLTKYYQLPEVLLKYGQPSDVLFAAWQLDPIWKAPYDPMSLVLIYEDLGVMVEYIFPSELVDGKIIGCPLGAKINVFSWSQNANLSIEEVIKTKPGTEGITPVSLERYKPIEETTSLSQNEFYEEFLNLQACISTPAKLWPPS